MSNLRSTPRRDPKLRLALSLSKHFDSLAAKPDPAYESAQRLLYQVDSIRRLARFRDRCRSAGWVKADLMLAHRQASELRNLHVVPPDEAYTCDACDNTLCGGCECRSDLGYCVDCDYSFCRNCLKSKDGDLLCGQCLEDRESREAEELDEDDEPQPLTRQLNFKETAHAQTTT